MYAFLILALVLPLGPPDIAVTRWMSPDSSRPMTFSEWQAGLSRTDDWKINHINTIGSGFVDRVDILVQDSLVPVLAASLDTMTADLVREGYAVASFSVSRTSPESLRAFLQAEYDSGLVAAVLVGDLPVAWYQLINDFQGNGSNDGYEEFPCDLYFMDLDGIWLDSFVRLDSLDSLVPGFDSIYDSHTGALLVRKSGSAGCPHLQSETRTPCS